MDKYQEIIQINIWVL